MQRSRIDITIFTVQICIFFLGYVDAGYIHGIHSLSLVMKT